MTIPPPQFNDSLGYLGTIRWMINTSHIASLNKSTWDDWHLALSQLHIEIYPRLNEEEQTELNNLYNSTTKNPSYKAYREYHLKLNLLIHKHKLAMKDEDTFDEDSVWD